MNMIAVTNRHKTKAIGIIGVIVGVLQASGQLKTLLTPDAYGWVTIVFGVVTAVIGFLNSQQISSVQVVDESERKP